MINSCLSPVYPRYALEVMRSYDFLPVRLSDTPAVASNWGSTELRWGDAIDFLALSTAVPELDHDLRPNFALQGRVPLVKIDPRKLRPDHSPPSNRQCSLASRGRDREVRSLDLGYVGGFETEASPVAYSRPVPAASRSVPAPELPPLVYIILVFGRNNDRNEQRFVGGRFGDRIWTYFCIKIIVSNHFRYFVGPNAVPPQSKRRPKIVILHLQSLYKVPKKVLLRCFRTEYVT